MTISFDELVEIKKRYVPNLKDIRADREKYLEYCRDKSIPIQDRIDAWLSMPLELQVHGDWIVHYADFEKKYGEISYYDDLYIERYQTVYVIDHLLDNLPNHIVERNEDLDESDVTKDLFENIVKEGYHTFNFDW